MSVRSSLALVVALGVTGCGAPYSYQPANSPRVSVRDTPDGSVVYKNGKRYPNIREAVADNPRALEEARTARSITVTSTWLFLGGVGLDIAGVSMGGAGAAGNDKTLALAGWTTALAGLCIAIAGSVISGTARTHALNAINIYNDDVEAKMFIRRPAPAPSGAPATPTPASR